MKDIQTNLKITEGYFPRLFMIFFCMLWTLGLFAQSTREVKGVVKDPTGETVIGASVLEKEPLMVLLQILMEILC